MSTPPYDPPAEGHGGQSPHEPEPRCPRCGAAHDPLQEYCLECGLRLVALPRQGYVRSIVWTRESPVWLWIALAALLLVALAAGGIVALAATDDEEGAGGGVSSAQDTDGVSTLPTTISINTVTTPSTLTLPTTSTLPTTTLPTTTTQPTTSTQPTTTGTSGIISWPAGENGYTVIIKSTPVSQGRGPAESAAHQATSAGLPQVGILTSSDYSSLNPGYYVTFTGIYDTQSQANAALPNVRSKGFPTAYPRQISD